MRSRFLPQYQSVRTVTVRLFPNGAQQRKLKKLAGASARLYNVVNYERR
ncbi:MULTISPECIES: helix-turn-helix domain-containing protein [Sulfolobaceae]|nr:MULTISPECIES: helix-turn-helix domain-containing protein [unclassified Sulfolobus]